MYRNITKLNTRLSIRQKADLFGANILANRAALKENTVTATKI